MTRKEFIKENGTERILDMIYFLDKLNRYYSFPCSDITLYDFIEDLREFNKEDLESCLKILEDRQSVFPLRFDEIKNACKKAKQTREKSLIKNKILFLKTKKVIHE